MRIRRRMANSMTIMPTGCPGGSRCSGSPWGGAAPTVRVVGEVAVRKPGWPVSGEVHSLPVASRAVMTANVRSAKKARVPPRSSAGFEHAAEAGCLHLYARALLDGQLAAVESHGGEWTVRRHQLAAATAERLTTGQSFSTSATRLK